LRHRQIEEEKQLKRLVSETVSAEAIAKKLGKTFGSVSIKMRRLGLVEVDSKKITSTSTAQVESDEDLITPKEALDLLSAAMSRMKCGTLGKLDC
jgi:hypothetical protein